MKNRFLFILENYLGKPARMELFGMQTFLFSKKGKYAVSSFEDGNAIVSFQIAQGNWYFDLLDRLEDEFGKYGETYDSNGLTYYVWRTE